MGRFSGFRTLCGFLGIGALGLIGPGAQARIPLTAQGRATCVIVSQPGATPAERHAAQELAGTLRRITGASFPIVETGRRPTGPAIVVGPGPVAASMFSQDALGRLGGEQSVERVRGRCLLLAGGRPRGTLYAVERFLQTECGVRWWTPWASTIPHHPTLSVAGRDRTETPAFEARDPFWFPAFDADWAARSESNSQSAHPDAAHGGALIYKGFVHTFYSLVPPAQYAAIHPEWYSLVNGRRTFQNAQLCTTNPQLRDFLVDRVRELIKASPDASIVSLSQNDCGGACECPDCKTIDDREGSRSGSMLALVNYVAARIGHDYPHVAIDTLAYQYTRRAPRTIRPLPNVIVRLCSIECSFAAPLTDPSNASFAQDMADWHRLCHRLYIWDYTTNFAHYVLPHPNWFVLGPNLRFFRAHGARGVFEEGAYQSNGAEMAELRAWVLAQLLRNPAQDDRALIREFLTGYYGPAAANIWDYLTLMAEKAQGAHLGFASPADASFLDFPTLCRAERLWQRAEDAVRTKPDLLWRVRQGRLPVRYAFLARWTPLRRECLRLGAAWPLPDSRKAVADAWLATAIGPGPAGWTPMTHVNEGGETPRQYVAGFAQDPPDPVVTPLPPRRPAPPPPVGVSETASGVDVQDNLARLANDGEWAEVRADPASSDGLAVWMPGSHHEWATQFPLATLPARVRTGRWRVYAVIRVEKAPTAAPSSTAFTVGIYDPTRGGSQGRIGPAVRDATEAYQPYLVGTVDGASNQYVWIAPAANPGIGAVWVDRLFLVPVR